MKFCVLMSTYNGEKYILEQLDSIITQAINVELEIVIRDDYSKDKTVQLLYKYGKEKRIKLTVINGDNCGPANSFLELIRKCPDADIYAFCDQDDVWKPGKVEKIIQDMLFDVPCLWFSNYDVVDSNLNIIHRNAMADDFFDDLTTLFYNTVPGCVMAFNHCLLERMREISINSIRMHDIMALNIALICGKVIFCKDSYIFYRQHENNVVGYGHKEIKVKQWVTKKIILLRNKEPYSTSSYAKEILDNFGQLLNKKQKNEYRLLTKLDNNIIARLCVLGKYYTRHKFDRTGISIRCKILLGLM